MAPESTRDTSAVERDRLPVQRNAARALALPMQLSPQQADAAEHVRRWFRNPHSPQVFRLFGYAGTGKTTLVSHIISELGVDPRKVIYAAFTGKAAHVLAGKGCEPARTIHSLIYQPSGGKRDKLAELEETLAAATDPREIARLRDEIALEATQLDSPRFTRRATSDVQTVDLVVVDECSMIDERMADDLESYGTKLLVLGDPMQLPPFRGKGPYIDARPDVLLTEIHRSAADSPVTAIATAVRNSDDRDGRLGVHGPVGDSGRTPFGSPHDYDQVICWRNKTRWALIERMRTGLGRGPDPVIGDRIVFKANNAELEVRNGQQAVIVEIEHEGSTVLDLIVDTDDGRRDVRVLTRGFAGLAGELEVKDQCRSGEVAAATFAQVITAHTAQGSQWPSVLVVDETHEMKGSSARERRRWLYTAVTRASERVVIVDAPRGSR